MARKKIKKQDIIDILKLRNSYDITDDILVDILIDNLEIARLAKKNIKEEGISPPDVNMQNPSLFTFNSAFKNISTILTKLALTQQEKIKIGLDKKQDNIDDILGD
ncbi:MAG: P27 family phage terminase small subunit [bacterium]